MSGLYIPNIELPTCCAGCHLRDALMCEMGGSVPSNRRIDDCPLIEIPPHGRLVDADKMKESIKNQSEVLMHFGDDDLQLIAEVLKVGFLQEIDNAPTIIPASEEGE